MNKSDVYNSGYDFAKKTHDIRIKRLKIITIIFPLMIVMVLMIGVISPSKWFKGKSETVDQLFPKAKTEDAKIEAYTESENAYKKAKIPYDDPQKRFSIIFLTPYVSGDIVVVIKNNKDYDGIKKEADELLDEARNSVAITSVTYINNFDN